MGKTVATKEKALEEIVKYLKQFVNDDSTAFDDLYIELGNGFYIKCEKGRKNYKVVMW